LDSKAGGVCDGDIESGDLMMANYAERIPKGFAFIDTAFTVFVLMALLCLKVTGYYF
jgi:hypothetical protein